ncbi:MAG TPA: tetratricopeptide repeat protein [Thermoanaerobaculia bacterium]|nr:tetratricopeptide repeat protein [Thermoanaerobaculia bacterium]
MTKFLIEHPVMVGLGVFCSILVGLSEISGFNLRELVRLWKSGEPAALSDEVRSTLRLRLRKLASDGALSVDESQDLRGYVASLKLEAQAAERYLSEIEPRMLQAARALQEGAELAAQERFPEARARFREATRLDDESSMAWANLGGASLELGALADAEAALRKALALEPDSIEAHYNFGACLAAQNRGAAALDHLERSLTLLLRGDAPPTFGRQALLDDLQKNVHFSSLRASPRFAALIQRAQNDFR